MVLQAEHADEVSLTNGVETWPPGVHQVEALAQLTIVEALCLCLSVQCTRPGRNCLLNFLFCVLLEINIQFWLWGNKRESINKLPRILPHQFRDTPALAQNLIPLAFLKLYLLKSFYSCRGAAIGFRLFFPIIFNTNFDCFYLAFLKNLTHQGTQWVGYFISQISHLTEISGAMDIKGTEWVKRQFSINEPRFCLVFQPTVDK